MTAARCLSVVAGVLFFAGCTLGQNSSVVISSHDVTVIVSKTDQFYIHQSEPIALPSSLKFVRVHDADLVRLVPPIVQFEPNVTDYVITLLGVRPGHMEITASVVPVNNFDIRNIFLRVTVAHSCFLIYLSTIVGWLYFVAWSVSFYPQIWTNYKRRSVTGLNFDFLTLNAIGFALYSMFNAVIYWNEHVQDEYMNRYPHGMLPVLGNDVVFSIHAFLATLVTIGQCAFYERGMQRVSNGALLFVVAILVTVLILVGLSAGSILQWLDFLTYCSYIKLLITLVKYIPQAVMNYRRKSTVGWSIGNIFLDFTGGMLSMLQMIINGYNYDDWSSIFGDPTKFGLGLFSVMFDIFFIVQHYVLYRNSEPYNELRGDTNADEAVAPDAVVA